MALIDVNKRERLEHPEEPGQWIEIRPLRATEMDEARDIRLKQLLDMWGDALNSAPRPETKKDEDTVKARAQQFDASTLLKYAVVGWSYTDGSVDPKDISRLDAVTRDWLVEEIVSRNSRPLVR